MPERYADVALDIPHKQPFTYRVPEGMALQPGARVLVTAGRREMVGIVTALSDACALSSVRDIRALYDDIAPLAPNWISLAGFAARYYQRGFGETALPQLPAVFRSRQRPSHARRLEKLRTLPEIAPPAPQAPPELNGEQEGAARSVSQAEGFTVFALMGVTGSGKTEVYLHAIREKLLKNPDGQVLLLVPEINLTPQLEARVRERFPDKRVMTMHSALSATERARAWLAFHEGRGDILISTRMGIFASMRKLCLIIVDEEHDLSYKADDGIRFNARDLAVKRAAIEKCPVVLGSATPSLETWMHVRNGDYRLLELTGRAVPGAIRPELVLVDPRAEAKTGGITKTVAAAVTETLEKGEQTLFFINRRGYAPVLTCPACGWISECPHCSAHTVYHKSRFRMICHHCGYSEAVPRQCPQCGNQDLQALGAGTQRIEETLSSMWPKASILRIDADTTSRKGSAQKAFEAVHEGRADIVVGTQMIAKGHDFQRVSTVAVLDIDAQIAAAGPRSEERAFVNLMQVAGRAGRSGLPSRLFVQTRFSDRLLFKALEKGDYEMFADETLEERAAEGAVPYVYQALLSAQAPTLEKALSFLKEAKAAAQAIIDQGGGEAVVYDPVPMSLVRLQDKERAQLLVEAPSRAKLIRFLREWNAELIMIRTGAAWHIDVDPEDI